MLHLINVYLYISIATRIIYSFLLKYFLKIETNWCLSSNFQHYFSTLVVLCAIVLNVHLMIVLLGLLQYFTQNTDKSSNPNLTVRCTKNRADCKYFLGFFLKPLISPFPQKKIQKEKRVEMKI